MFDTRNVFKTLMWDKVDIYRNISSSPSDSGSVFEDVLQKYEPDPIETDSDCGFSQHLEEYKDEFGYNLVRTRHKLFVDPDTNIKEGDKLIIRQMDILDKSRVVNTIEAVAGDFFPYSGSHCEINLLEVKFA